MKTIFVVSLFFIQLSFSQVQFTEGSLADVMSKAKTENKVLMVDVLTDWCKWCIELDNKVYSKKDVGDFANANQINYKIDAEKGDGIDFAKKYGVSGYPTILFIDKDGNEIDRVVGYIPAKDFLATIMDYNKGVNTLAYLQTALAKDPENIEACLKMADKQMTLGNDADAKKYLQNIIDKDPENKSGKKDDAEYKLASMSDKETVVQNLTTFIEKNQISDVLKDAMISLAESYAYSKNDYDNTDKTYSQLAEKFPNDESVSSSRGQYLISRAVNVADKEKEDAKFKDALVWIETAMPLVAGSVNEASANYVKSKLQFNLKDYQGALESVDKALKIFNRKLYRDHKEKIEKQLSSK